MVTFTLFYYFLKLLFLSLRHTYTDAFCQICNKGRWWPGDYDDEARLILQQRNQCITCTKWVTGRWAYAPFISRIVYTNTAPDHSKKLIIYSLLHQPKIFIETCPLFLRYPTQIINHTGNTTSLNWLSVGCKKFSRASAKLRINATIRVYSATRLLILAYIARISISRSYMHAKYCAIVARSSGECWKRWVTRSIATGLSSRAQFHTAKRSPRGRVDSRRTCTTSAFNSAENSFSFICMVSFISTYFDRLSLTTGSAVL